MPRLSREAIALWDQLAAARHASGAPAAVCYEATYGSLLDLLATRKKAIEEVDDPAGEGDAYFLQYHAAQWDLAVFERAERKGYTVSLADAGRFTRAEAEAAIQGVEDVRRMFPVSDVTALASLHVAADALRRLHKERQAR